MTKTATKPIPRSIPHETSLVDSLRKDPAFAADYLQTCMLEGTREEFLLALRRVTKAYGGISKLATATGLNENTLHRTLSAKGNPRLSTFISICAAVGMDISITPSFSTSQGAQHNACGNLPEGRGFKP
jgi:probable addiction module antidote protein